MAETIITFLRGDKVDDKTDYRDALPVNCTGVVRPILGAQGYMLELPGLTEYGADPAPEEHEYVTLDGSTTLIFGSSLTGISDGKLGTLVTRIRRSANNDDQLLCLIIDDSGPTLFGLLIDVSSAGLIRIVSQDLGANTILSASSDVAFNTPGECLCICLSWDAATAPLLVVNDTLITMTVTDWVDQNLDYTGTDSNVFGDNRPFGGDTNFLWFDSTANMDFTVESNIRKFFDANGCPVDLGADGSTPTGAPPIVYLSGDSSTFATNKGTGGGFTVSGGVLTDGSAECP